MHIYHPQWCHLDCLQWCEWSSVLCTCYKSCWFWLCRSDQAARPTSTYSNNVFVTRLGLRAESHGRLGLKTHSGICTWCVTRKECKWRAWLTTANFSAMRIILSCGIGTGGRILFRARFWVHVFTRHCGVVCVTNEHEPTHTKKLDSEWIIVQCSTFVVCVGVGLVDEEISFRHARISGHANFSSFKLLHSPLNVRRVHTFWRARTANQSTVCFYWTELTSAIIIRMGIRNIVLICARSVPIFERISILHHRIVK